MEDPSVDTITLDRKEVLARLNLKPSSSFSTIDLRTKLKNSLQRNHPIHQYLSQLSNEDLGKLFMIIFKKSGCRKYDKMRKSVANNMFMTFPQAPLTTLIWMKCNKKVPTNIEFDIILKEISLKTKINKPHEACGEFTMTEDVPESSYNEVSPDVENTSSKREKQKLDSKNTNPAAKKFKST